MLRVTGVVHTCSKTNVFTARSLGSFFTLSSKGCNGNVVGGYGAGVVLGVRSRRTRQIGAVLRLSRARMVGVARFRQNGNLVSAGGGGVAIRFGTSGLRGRLVAASQRRLLRVLTGRGGRTIWLLTTLALPFSFRLRRKKSLYCERAGPVPSKH